PTPDEILATPGERLRQCGLSRGKIVYVGDLARRWSEGEIDPVEIAALDDEGVIERLVRVRGVGRWTAEMFLIFHLMRPNVLPLDDVGLQNGISRCYFSGEPVSRSEIREVAANWAPFCSVATWYIWRSLDPAPVAY
ncbi:MAG: DNA-3-methyladenine glycosylase 2 family protein, partial [Hydrogenophaga sp.]|nr:DNA-3-methyladenine glycosylase 2 family protein [Hydrogenophaga sp.]